MYLRKFKFRKRGRTSPQNISDKTCLFLVCLFVYFFVCTSYFANFAKGKWSNHDSKNCSEIRTVTWSVIWLWKLQFTILIFFTPLYYTGVSFLYRFDFCKLVLRQHWTLNIYEVCFGQGGCSQLIAPNLPYNYVDLDY